LKQTFKYKLQMDGKPQQEFYKKISVKGLTGPTDFNLVWSLVGIPKLNSKPILLKLNPSREPGKLQLIDQKDIMEGVAGTVTC